MNRRFFSRILSILLPSASILNNSVKGKAEEQLQVRLTDRFWLGNDDTSGLVYCKMKNIRGNVMGFQLNLSITKEEELPVSDTIVWSSGTTYEVVFKLGSIKPPKEQKRPGTASMQVTIIKRPNSIVLPSENITRKEFNPCG